jgi:glycosyltransferase involved in cell wall biosynthesis
VKDLLIGTHTPVLGSGQAVRTYGVARALAAHGGLTLLYARFGADEPDEAFSSIPGIELIGVVPSRRLRRALGYARARIGGVPPGFARGISPELSAAAARLADAPGRRRVIADGPIAAAAVAALASRRPVHYNAHNVESAFRHELDDRGRREHDALAAFERGVLERSCESWMVSAADLRTAGELAPGARLRYVPNVVDVAAIEPLPQNPDARRAIFVASFVYPPNANGLRFLIDEVFPRVWAELPDARLTLVGRGLQELPSSDPRVEVLGFVDDLRAAYASASCALVPLLQGGGSPLKFIEALAFGVPVIATPRAAAGLEVSDGRDCVIADGADAYAAAVLRVMRDGAPELALRGRKLAEERYSIEALSAILAP